MNHITYEERKAVYEQALAKWGIEAQSQMAIEEMSELTKELCKVYRGARNRRELAEEIADVKIMLEQLLLMYEIGPEVDYHMDLKIRRLEKKLLWGE